MHVHSYRYHFPPPPVYLPLKWLKGQGKLGPTLGLSQASLLHAEWCRLFFFFSLSNPRALCCVVNTGCPTTAPCPEALLWIASQCLQQLPDVKGVVMARLKDRKDGCNCPSQMGSVLEQTACLGTALQSKSCLSLMSTCMPSCSCCCTVFAAAPHPQQDTLVPW